MRHFKRGRGGPQGGERHLTFGGGSWGLITHHGSPLPVGRCNVAGPRASVNSSGRDKAAGGRQGRRRRRAVASAGSRRARWVSVSSAPEQPLRKACTARSPGGRAAQAPRGSGDCPLPARRRLRPHCPHVVERKALGVLILPTRTPPSRCRRLGGWGVNIRIWGDADTQPVAGSHWEHSCRNAVRRTPTARPCRVLPLTRKHLSAPAGAQERTPRPDETPASTARMLQPGPRPGSWPLVTAR